MLLLGNSVTRSHYDILSVKEDASYEDIRVKYKAAILSCHPDKLCAKSETFDPNHELQDKFLDVQNAWEVLSNSKSRANYDKELQASRHEAEVVDDEITWREMVVETVGDSIELCYQCRCGDYFSVTSMELEEMGISLDKNGVFRSPPSTHVASTSIILPCGSCSLKIRLIIDVNG